MLGFLNRIYHMFMLILTPIVVYKKTCKSSLSRYKAKPNFLKIFLNVVQNPKLGSKGKFFFHFSSINCFFMIRNNYFI